MNHSLKSVFVTFLLAGLTGAAAVAAPLPDPAKLRLASANALIVAANDETPIYAKNPENVTPIASITKLMTAMVVLDARQSMDDLLTIDMADLDMLKGSHSRLRLGVELPRKEMLRLALMSSENRAASALCRYYPGGTDACVTAMNVKAAKLGMNNSHFNDPTGLSSDNMSTAKDLVKMVKAASEYPLIREFSTTPAAIVDLPLTGRPLAFQNTNALVRGGTWDIQLQKTGFIREAGRCLVMMANVASQPVVIVLLDSIGRMTRIGDAMRIRHWLETGESMPTATKVSAHRKRVFVRRRY
jgi:D-alanyl-D-alanine endopeptidase (penicillin-binding protein 7)